MLELATICYTLFGTVKAILVITGTPVVAAVIVKHDSRNGYIYHLMLAAFIGSFIAFIGWPWLLHRERSRFFLMYSRFSIVRETLRGIAPTIKDRTKNFSSEKSF